MNAGRLLAHYETVAEAPDAIPCLRRFVLDLAVRGKLVPQDPNDEPAEELLRRIEAEKARLVKAGEIKSPKDYESPNGMTLTPPDGWEIVPLGTVINQHMGGGTPSKSNHAYWDGEIRWASVKDVGKSKFLDDTIDRITEEGLSNSSSNLIPPGNLIVVTRMGLGQLSINRIPVAINQDLRALFLSSLVAIDFVYNFFLTHSMRGTGLTVKGIKLDKLLTIPFPLPPLAEQRRIVAKVEELMGLLDGLKAARAEREAARDRLTTASLARLTAKDAAPGDFPAHARFALDALPALTARPDQIKTLRQTILNLAVRGKLVEQDPNDEPAEELLKRIQAEKARLVKAGEIRRPRAVPPLESSDIPFPLPHGWAWTQIAELGIISPRNDADDDFETSFVPMPMIAAEYGATNGNEPRRWGEIKKGYTHFAEGDVGLAKITPCFENGKSTVFRNLTGGIGAGTTELHVVRPLFVDADYIVLFLKSPHFIETGIPKMTGTAGQKRVPTEYFTSSPFPLPPLAEQHRIVAKVDALMALCDRLEAALTTAHATRARLLASLLHEALEPSAAALQAASCSAAPVPADPPTTRRGRKRR